MPRLSDDDVVDFMVMEAMTVKMGTLRQQAEREQKRQQFRESHRQMRGMKAGMKAPPLPGGMG